MDARGLCCRMIAKKKRLSPTGKATNLCVEVRYLPYGVFGHFRAPNPEGVRLNPVGHGI